jgi:hypothetical protein
MSLPTPNASNNSNARDIHNSNIENMVILEEPEEQKDDKSAVDQI